MLKRFAPICLSATLATWGHAQDADPAAAEPQITSRAVMSGDQVVRILDETVDWYRMLGVQQQSATQPSDLLILYANRQTADRVVALAFELARANAELLSSQAEMEQADAPDSDAPSSPQVLQRDQRNLDARRTAIQTEIAATQRQLAAAETAERGALQARVAELQSELDLLDARRNLLHNMVDFAHETDANGSGVSTLKEHINAIAASIPAASGAMPEIGAAEAQTGAAGTGGAAPPSATEQVGARRFGIWDLATNVLRLQSKVATIDEIDRRTEELQQTFTQTRVAPEQQIAMLSARGDALGARPAASAAAELKTARDEYDTIAWLFQQTSSILVPLTKAGVLLEQYRNNLDSWRDATRTQYRSALKTLAVRAGLLLLLLAARVRCRRAVEACRIQVRARGPATRSTTARAPNRDVGGRACDHRRRVRHRSELVRNVRRPADRRRRRRDAERARVDRRLLLPRRQIRPARRRSRSDRRTSPAKCST